MKKFDLEKITASFGKAYSRAEKADAAKAKAQAKFYEAVDATLENATRKQLLVTHEDTSVEAETWVSLRYPGWRLLEQHGDQLIIEENPSFMKYAYVNHGDGMVYQRTVSQGGPSLDDEALRANDPELWDEISEWPEPWYSLIYNFAVELIEPTDANLKRLEEELDEHMEENGLHRMLSDPNGWTDEQMERVKPYMVPGKLTVRIIKPRPAKDEELES